MARKPARYKLPLYERTMRRWLSATFWLGVVLAGFGTYLYFFIADITLSNLGAYTLWGLGGLSLFITLILFLLRRGSYVRLFPTYLYLVTPFLRTKVPYSSIKRTSTQEVRVLFPYNKIKGQRADILLPFATRSAIVLHLDKFPLPAGLLHTFLSPFYFVDKSPHFVLIVEDWLTFSTELESLRTGTPYRPQQQESFMMNPSGKPKQKPKAAAPPPKKKSGSGLLSSLNDDDKR
jgi:hypothetical protein